MHEYDHIYQNKNCNSCFPANFTVFLLVLLFPTNVTAKKIILSQADIIVFYIIYASTSQSLSNFVCCLIIRSHVQKKKQNLILFHLFGMMIIFIGLMKITGNAYGVIKNSK